jgi:hypothetical protein
MARTMSDPTPARPEATVELPPLTPPQATVDLPPTPPEASQRTSSFALDVVHDRCAGFTGEWAAGARQELASYLACVGDAARPTLLRNLLAIDLERRRAAGEQPQVQEPREARAPAVPLARGDADP